jgi:hypothetical protein
VCGGLRRRGLVQRGWGERLVLTSDSGRGSEMGI